MDARTYKIYFASGEPFQQDAYTATEAAQIVADHPWAWADRDGDIIVSTYRTRCGADEYQPVTGCQMAARLRKGRPLMDIHGSGADGHNEITLALAIPLDGGGKLFESWNLCECSAGPLRNRLFEQVGPPDNTTRATAAEVTATTQAVLRVPADLEET